MEKYIANNKVLIISHIGDPDGAGGIILSKIVFDKIDYVLIHVNEQDNILKYINNNYEKVFIIDIPLEDKVADEIAKLNLNIHHFDHHKTNLYPNKYQYANVSVELNNRLTCGTELFYDYLIKNDLLKNEPAIKEFVELVRLYDTWDWKKDNNLKASDLNTLFEVLGPINFIEDIYENIIKAKHFIFTEEEHKLITLRNNEIQDTINKWDKKFIRFSFEGYTSAVMFIDRYQSILGNEICLRHSDIDFSMMINIIDRKVSLRSTKVDVGSLAQKYGGGGHKFASSFPLTDESMKNLFLLLSEK